MPRKCYQLAHKTALGSTISTCIVSQLSLNKYCLSAGGLSTKSLQYTTGGFSLCSFFFPCL